MGELLARFKLEYLLDINKVAFAGRLDPLACGIVTMLTDTDIYAKDNYCARSKIYECNIIEGICTDTYDIMGICTISSNSFNPIFNSVANIKYIQEYPPYSSQLVTDITGTKRPLWVCTKNNIKYIDTPTKNITLHEGKQLSSYQIDKDELNDLIKNRINLVKSQTFRQDMILESWDKLLSLDYFNDNNLITIGKWQFTISSGGYIRYLGNKMNGSCFDIERISYIE